MTSTPPTTNIEGQTNTFNIGSQQDDLKNMHNHAVAIELSKAQTYDSYVWKPVVRFSSKTMHSKSKHSLDNLRKAMQLTYPWNYLQSSGSVD